MRTQKSVLSQITKAYNWTVGGLYNCVQDRCYEELKGITKEDIKFNVYEELSSNYPKDLRFYGKEATLNLIENLMKDDSDVIEIIEAGKVIAE